MNEFSPALVWQIVVTLLGVAATWGIVRTELRWLRSDVTELKEAAKVSAATTVSVKVQRVRLDACEKRINDIEEHIAA